MGAKKKLKKMLYPPADENLQTEADDELLDDLLAQLDSKDKTVQKESAAVVNQMSQAVADSTSRNRDANASKARYQARQAKKAAELEQRYAPTDAEADARIEREAKEEEAGIKRVCEELSLVLHEINPDGHCLFSAVADQLALLGILPSAQATYATCRITAANYIYSHRDDFLPFLPSEVGEDAAGATDPGLMTLAQFESYCQKMRDSAVWGGEPEILALSRAYDVPIHVVQGGIPPVVVHSPWQGQREDDVKAKAIVYISYHRRQYGLGEHYNSLRPKTLLTTIKSAFH